jgi:transketolase
MSDNSTMVDSTGGIVDTRNIGLTNEQKRLRKVLLQCLYDSGGGHYGGSLSALDIIHVLCKDVVFLPRHTSLDTRDKLILSKGHAAPALYTVMSDLGLIPGLKLSGYARYGGMLEGHPDMTTTPHVDFSTGSLGQGYAVGLGIAIALRPFGRHVWVIVGDGECQEGQLWETMMIVSRYRVTNLHLIIDENGAQECGWGHRPEISQLPLVGLMAKLTSFGLSVSEIDGHNEDALKRTFSMVREGDMGPTAIIARTRKGAGIHRMEEHGTLYHDTSRKCVLRASQRYRRREHVNMGNRRRFGRLLWTGVIRTNLFFAVHTSRYC